MFKSQKIGNKLNQVNKRIFINKEFIFKTTENDFYLIEDFDKTVILNNKDITNIWNIPDTIEILNLSNNPLDNHEIIIPKSVVNLDISGTDIKELKFMNNSIEYLNMFKCFPENVNLPENIKCFITSSNKTFIGKNIDILDLRFTNKWIDTLSSIPRSVKELYISNNIKRELINDPDHPHKGNCRCYKPKITKETEAITHINTNSLWDNLELLEIWDIKYKKPFENMQKKSNFYSNFKLQRLQKNEPFIMPREIKNN